MTPSASRRPGWLAALACAVAVAPALAQTPLGAAFTYQGRLNDSGSPANGAYDLRFTLYDAASAGSQVGTPVTLSSVTVSSGLFTASLDFGTSVFAGSKRWLEVGARPGGSAGAFTTLSPRQELTPAPNAAFSSTTGDTTVQRRTVAPTCAVGSYVRSLAADGTPTCALDSNSGGTVTGVGSGAGLTGGPITGSGSLSIATGGVTSSMVANGAIGLAQINQAQVQARIGGSCAVGEYFRGINADGTVLCQPVPGLQTITTVDDPANAVGLYASMKMGNDGLPVIAYYDSTAGALKVAKCVNAACTGTSTITTVDDPVNSVGTYAALAIGADGLPVISYRDFQAAALKVAKCANAACTGAATITTVDDTASDVGRFTSIAIGADGLPVISYYDNTAGALKVAKCANAACTGASTITTVDDPANAVGWYASIAMGHDAAPVISYYDATAGALKVAKCANPACTGASTITTADDPANNVGQYTWVVLGTDNLPAISYYDATAGALKVAKCANAACTGASTITTVDAAANDAGRYTSIAIGADGLPVISYQDVTAAALKVAKCANASCTGSSTITVVEDPANSVGFYTSIAIGTDGMPVISYQDSTAAALKVAKCGTRTCQ